MAHKLAYLHCLSPLHAGTGQGVGAIDLPIARERVTNLPLVPGSTIRGCLRDAMRDHPDATAIFGPERIKSGEEDFAGALHVSDAHLLLLPLRSLSGVFVWATSPYILRRFRRDAEHAGETGLPDVPEVKESAALVSSSDAGIKIGDQQKLILEDFDFAPDASNAAAKSWCEWFKQKLFQPDWQSVFEKRFTILEDNAFDYFAEYATEVTAHIKMDAGKGTVDKQIGGLWYQEALPTETILYLLLESSGARNGKAQNGEAILNAIQSREDVQFGGKAGTGLGFTRFVTEGSASGSKGGKA